MAMRQKLSLVSGVFSKIQVLKSWRSHQAAKIPAIKRGYAFSPQTVIDLGKKLRSHQCNQWKNAPKALIEYGLFMYRRSKLFKQNQAVWGQYADKFSVQLFAPGFLFQQI